jgi:hypothetical protein
MVYQTSRTLKVKLHLSLSLSSSFHIESIYQHLDSVSFPFGKLLLLNQWQWLVLWGQRLWIHVAHWSIHIKLLTTIVEFDYYEDQTQSSICSFVAHSTYIWVPRSTISFAFVVTFHTILLWICTLAMYNYVHLYVLLHTFEIWIIQNTFTHIICMLHAIEEFK